MMTYSIAQIILLFFIYSVIGWLWETIYCSLQEGQFVYRGFLFGPYCPVYGFAVVSVLLAVNRVSENIYLVFLVGIVVATVFEYFAGFLLETFFHLKLWDYSNYRYNLKGRIAPIISLFWGFGVVFLEKCIQPPIMEFCIRIEQKFGVIAAGMVVLVMGSDTLWTILSVSGLHQKVLAWQEKLVTEKEHFTTEILQKLHQEAQDSSLWRKEFKQRLQQGKYELHHFNFNQRRLLKNFGKLSLLDAPNVTEVKAELRNYLKKKK